MSDPFVTAMGIIGSRELTEELLVDIMGKLKLIFPEMDLESTRKLLEARVGLTMSAGEGLSSGEVEPWIDDVKASTRWIYWDSYTKQLQSQGFTAPILRALDEDTDNILTECGNPAAKEPWRVQGLVMGDVQSGKTANYCGLVCKAADAGYKVVVLLTGMIEELRSQSQERLDEGFVGQDSNEIIEGLRSGVIGAGRYREPIPNVLTSVNSDFLTSNQKALNGIPLQNLSEPVLLVMKKNVTPLKRLLIFLKDQMRHGAKQLDLPLLIIDDEADNASVNAKKDESPAAINRLIRELLGQFKRASYVGYTATPFANIFINPDPERNDLFPSNFIYSLKAPSSYIGAASMFSEDGEHAGQLVDIVDAEVAFPAKHGKNLEIKALPTSLEDAIGAFLISCAIRDLRKESLNHRSMLINVSRFTQVQAALAERVNSHLYVLQNEIKQYLAADGLWEKHAQLVRLHEVYLEHYGDSGAPWDLVRAKLFDAVASVKVLTINQRTEAEEKLNYRKYRNTEKGRRVIAIGGLTLSRGLTLEGLCVSYFYRHSKAYDTLLQMGRWFGYRTGYDDLCRVWMTPEAQSWFSHIAEVISELRMDIRHMHLNRLPPSRFGMRVRSHPDTLLVTAQNKMRNSEEVEVQASFSGHEAETAILPNSGDVQSRQLRVTRDFLNELPVPENVGNKYVWGAVDSQKIASFLQLLDVAPQNQHFMRDASTGEQPLVEFIRNAGVSCLEKWDVCLPQGNGDVAHGLDFIGPAGVPVTPSARQRKFEWSNRLGSRYIALNRRRVGEASDEKVGLAAHDLEAVEADWHSDPETKGKSVPGLAYRKMRKRPLLTIHVIKPVGPSSKDESGKRRASRILPLEEIKSDTFVAVSLSFPDFEETGKTTVTYRINKVYLQNIGLMDDEEDSDDDAS